MHETSSGSVSRAFLKVQETPSRSQRRNKRFLVGPVAELPPGQKKIVQVENLSIGVFNIAGQYFAVRNLCPHQGAPLCQGHVQTTHAPSEVGVFEPALQGRVLRCPWHGWEFDIPTGQALYDEKARVATYTVTVENGEIFLDL